MAVDTIIEGVTNFFLKCPLLKNGAFRLNALGKEPVQYTIETGVFDPVVKGYINGDSERIYQFNFGSREYYSLDRIQNTANSAFYEKFAAWVEEQDRKENFPEMPDKCTPQSLRVLSSGYLYDGAQKNARYQIQLELNYYQEAGDHG